MLNKIILIGNLGGDPEDAVGNKPVTFSLATSERWRDKASGERREKTTWHNVAVFQRQAAEFAARYLKKGMKVYVEGTLSIREWTGNDGIKRYSPEILVKGFNHRIENLTRSNGGGYQPGGTLREHGFDDEPGAYEDEREAGVRSTGGGRQSMADMYQGPTHNPREQQNKAPAKNYDDPYEDEIPF